MKTNMTPTAHSMEVIHRSTLEFNTIEDLKKDFSKFNFEVGDIVKIRSNGKVEYRELSETIDLDSIIWEKAPGVTMYWNLVEFSSRKYTFGTIEEMKKAKYLKEGDVIELLGFYTAGDGAGHKRKICGTYDGSGEVLDNGKWACIVHDGEVNVSWFGIDYGLVNLIQRSHLLRDLHTLVIPKNTYVINKTIILDASITYNFADSTITPHVNMEVVEDSIIRILANNVCIENLTICGDIVDKKYKGISSTPPYHNIRIMQVNISNVKTGIFYRTSDSSFIEPRFGLEIVNCKIDNTQSGRSDFGDGGDAIYMSMINGVTVCNCQLSNIHRQGIAFTDWVSDCIIVENIFMNIGLAGIDLEPNSGFRPYDPSKTKNILIKGNNFKNCGLENYGQTSCVDIHDNVGFVNVESNFFDTSYEFIFSLNFAHDCNIRNNIGKCAKFANLGAGNGVSGFNITDNIVECTDTIFNNLWKCSVVICGNSFTYNNTVSLVGTVDLTLRDNRIKYKGGINNHALEFRQKSGHTVISGNTIIFANIIRSPLYFRNTAGTAGKSLVCYNNVIENEGDPISNYYIEENATGGTTGIFDIRQNTLINFITQYNFRLLDTPYYTFKMQEEGVYSDFISYMDEKHTYDAQQRESQAQHEAAYQEALTSNPELSFEDFLSHQPSMLPIIPEPLPSEALLAFKTKYLG